VKYPKRSQYKHAKARYRVQNCSEYEVALTIRMLFQRSIRELGRREWHTQSGYSRRSMVENAVYRYKTIIGRNMRSRTFEGERAEVQIACSILNTMTSLGMPDSYRLA
jgi:hypothetical protein